MSSAKSDILKKLYKIPAMVAIPVALGACAGEPQKPAEAPRKIVTVIAGHAPDHAHDPLGEKPQPAIPEPYQAPVPQVYKLKNGITVWLVERHSLPILSVTVAIPSGSSSDPKGKSGVALSTARMLDEGAGKLGMLDLAREIEMIGATLQTGASEDMSFASLHVLKANFPRGISLLGDVVVRPQFAPKEWKRVYDLWANELIARASDPAEIAEVVSSAVLYGPSHPYGSPPSGTLATQKRVGLGDVKQFYAAHWRPDRTTLVVAGDATRAELEPLLEGAFSEWKAPASPPPELVVPTAPKGPWPRVVVVDRSDAPQTIVTLVRPGLGAGESDAMKINRVNAALGGSFTSRLNQDLREEHGWTYGAHSHAVTLRGTGSVQASAPIFIDKTIEALKAMLADVSLYAEKGMTEDEATKTRLLARSGLVGSFETVNAMTFRLARDAVLGLPPDFETKASLARDGASRDDLNRIAAKYYDPKDASIVLVGPYDKLAPELSKAGFSDIELRDSDGLPKRVKGAQ